MAYQSDRALAEATAFAAVATAGGFTAAARSGGLRKATLTERVRDLEARLGVALLVRTTRSVRLTEEGRAYLEHVRSALDGLRAADAAVVESRGAVTGTLRVTVAPPLAVPLLHGVVAAYCARCPDVTVVVDAAISTVDLPRERFDVALRQGPLVDSSLRCRRLGNLPAGYFASPAYIARRGKPTSPDNFQAHDAITIPRGDRPPTWRFARRGDVRSVSVKPRVTVSTFEQGIAAAVAGLGIVPSPRFAVRDHLAAGRLLQVMNPWAPPTGGLFFVYPAGRLAAKTRLFMETTVAWFRSRRFQIR